MKTDKKLFNPLIVFIFWFLSFVIICLIGISNVFALTYENVDGYQNDITVVLVAPDYSNSPINVPIGSSLSFNQVREVIVQVDNFNFVANRNYQLELYLPQQDLGRANSYTVYGFNGESCLVSYDYSSFNGNYPRWAFQCPNSTNNITINIKNSSNQILWDDGPNGAPIFTWGYSYLRYSNSSLSDSGIGTDAIINNQNQNTQNIINNQNENTDKIINSNKETQEIIKDQFNTCRDSYNLLKFSSNRKPGYSFSSGGLTFTVNNDYSITVNGTNDGSNSYIYIMTGEILSLPIGTYIGGLYNNDFQLIGYDGTKDYNLLNVNTFSSLINFNEIYIQINTNSKGKSFNNFILKPIIVSGESLPTYEPYGVQICTNKIDETNNKLGNLNDILNNSNSSDATNSASDFFSGFTTDTFGLTSIITAPLNLIGSITSSSCTPLGLPLPYVNKTLELPCMSSIYSQYFGSFYTMYQTITYGIIAYWVIVRIFNLVKDFKNPDHDEIEVFDL